jgi:hypothetical protein
MSMPPSRTDWPDLPLWDIFMFVKLKIFLKVSHFESLEDIIKSNVMKVLKGHMKNDF